MSDWLKRNYKTIIRISYIIPILVAAGISIFHVISWYDITNPISWAIYLSIGIEIAALSALAGMTAKMSKFVYVPFIIVTFIQVLGNVFASYQYIDVTGEGFKAWVELFNPMFETFGWVENSDLMTHKRILGILGGIFIPLISLSFLHLLISFNDKEEKDPKGVELKKKLNNPLFDPKTGEIDLTPKLPIETDFWLDSTYDESESDITPDLLIPPTEHPEPEFEPDIEDVELETEETILEPISEPEVDKTPKDTPEPINVVKRVNTGQNRMNIERVGSNKVIKDGNSDLVYYKKGEKGTNE
jgi:hypothetical protein